jgi:YD repeat-containing protein
VTRYDWDLKGQLKTRTVDPGGLDLVTAFAYDAQGRTVSVKDPKGFFTIYRFDGLGRRIEEIVDPVTAHPPQRTQPQDDLRVRPLGQRHRIGGAERQ